MTLCACGSNLLYSDCCGPIIEGASAPNAEALIRSRYTAFATRQLDHIERTHAPEIRADFNRAEAERMAEECDWQGLKITQVDEHGDKADISFVIHFRHENQDKYQLERAHFRKEQDQWLYEGGEINPHGPQRIVNKVGRNDPCPCGSGKKAKKCCGTTTLVD